MSDTFPRQYARTQRLSLGEPRSFTVAPDGSRVIFIRSHSGSDAVNTLWSLDTATGIERELLDPRTLNTDLSELTPAELRQRERAREGASGVTNYACNRDVTLAVTVLGGSVVLLDLLSGEATMPAIEPGVFDVRLSPTAPPSRISVALLFAFRHLWEMSGSLHQIRMMQSHGVTQNS